MGSFSVRICRACRPALEPKTKVPAIASTKARPTATVRRHDSPTIQYSRFGCQTFRPGIGPPGRFRWWHGPCVLLLRRAEHGAHAGADGAADIERRGGARVWHLQAVRRFAEQLQRAPADHGDSGGADGVSLGDRSEEHTSELQSLRHLVCRLLLEKKKKNK